MKQVSSLSLCAKIVRICYEVFSDFSLCEGPGHVNEGPDKIS